MGRVHGKRDGVNRTRQGRAGVVIALILFTLIFFVNNVKAGWIHTDGEDFAVKFIYTLQTGDLKKIQPYLDPSLLTEDKKEALTHAIQVFPQGDIKAITRTHIQVNYSAGSAGKQEVLQFYVEWDDGAVVMEEVLQEKNGRFMIQGFHFNEAQMNLMDQFPFSAIGWVQPKNVFMAVGVLNAIFMTAVLVSLFFKPVKHKWLWLPVLFAGVTEASAQWVDDGPWSFTLLAFRYPAVWFTESVGQDPWSIIVSYPLGATLVLFLILTAKKEPEKAAMPVRRPVAAPARPPAPRQSRPQPVKVGK